MRRSRPPYDIDTLTQVALDVFATRGFDAASMDDVAREAGITKAAIYHHVSGKEALLERGLNRALEALFALLEEPEARAGAPLERLRFIVRGVAELALAFRPEVTVLVRVRGNSAVERHALARRRAFDAAVVTIVREAQSAGDIDAMFDPALVVRLVFGMCVSVVEWFRPGGSLPSAAVAQTIIDVVFAGLSRSG